MSKWYFTVQLHGGVDTIPRQEFDGTLEDCQSACHAMYGQHNIEKVRLTTGNRTRVFDHFPAVFDQPEIPKSCLRDGVSRLSSGVYESRDCVRQAIQGLFAVHGCGVGHIKLESYAGEVAVGITRGGTTIDYLLIRWNRLSG